VNVLEEIAPPFAVHLVTAGEPSQRGSVSGDRIGVQIVLLRQCVAL
jgi:hypothetical protein